VWNLKIENGRKTPKNDCRLSVQLINNSYSKLLYITVGLRQQGKSAE